jgi:hypothetical protein
MTLDLVRALTFPLGDGEWQKKVGIGVGLCLAAALTFLTLIGIPLSLLLLLGVLGYLVRTVRRAAEAEEGLPDWDELSDLLSKGITAGLALFAYSLVPGVLAVLGFAGKLLAILSGAYRDRGMGLVELGTSLLMGGLVVVVFLAVAYLMPMVLLRLALRGELAGAFALGDILAGIRQAPLDYTVVVALGLLGAGLVGWASTLLALVPFLGTLLQCLFLALAWFYLALVQADLLAQYHCNHQRASHAAGGEG